MGVRVPRITLNADFGDESAFGELSLLSVGYGLHQAWVYATMFGTASVFGPMPCFQGIYGSSVTIPYLISTIVYVFAMLLIAATDQRFLKLYTSRKLLCIGAALSCAGSLLLLAVPFFGTPLAETASGIMTGIGSAILIVYWGTAFARTDSASIVLNTAIAISIAIGLFATVLHYAPFPVSAIAIACVPLLELAILLKKTPQPFHERDEVPIFKPLPINRGRFVVRFGAPVLVLGIALGMLRTNSLQNLVMKTSVGAQPVLLLAAGCATVLVLVTIMALGGGDRWSRFFQPLVPFIAVTVFIMPLASTDHAALTSVIMLVGFLCFESLMWIFFADLSQRFRLSPILVFGLGRAILAVAIMFGALVPVALASYAHLLPFGEQALVILLLLVIVFAYALLPREREIESIIMPCPLVKAVSASFERKEESQRAAGKRNCGAAKGMETLEQGAAESAERRERAADDPAAEGEASALANRRAAAAVSAANARPWRTRSSCLVERPRSCSSWPKAITPPASRRSSTSRRARPRRISATSTVSATSTTSRISCAWSRTRSRRNSGASIPPCEGARLVRASSGGFRRLKTLKRGIRAFATWGFTEQLRYSARKTIQKAGTYGVKCPVFLQNNPEPAPCVHAGQDTSSSTWPSTGHYQPTALAGRERRGFGNGRIRDRRGFCNERPGDRRSRALDPLPRFPDASPGDSPLSPLTIK